VKIGIAHSAYLSSLPQNYHTCKMVQHASETHGWPQQEGGFELLSLRLKQRISRTQNRQQADLARAIIYRGSAPSGIHASVLVQF